MSIHRIIRSRRTLLATAIACALSLSAAPILAADAAATPGTQSAQPAIDPGLLRIAADTGRSLTDSMHAALVHLDSGDTAQARQEIRKGLRLTGVLKDVMPFAALPSQVAQAKSQLDGQPLEAFEQNMVPIAATLDEIELYAPEKTAKARQHLADARHHKRAGDDEGARLSLQLVSDDLVTGTAYLPVNKVRDQLKIAEEALDHPTPEPKVAEAALTDALDSVKVFIDDVGLPTDAATLASEAAVPVPDHPVSGTAYDVSVAPVPFISGGVGIGERQALERQEKNYNLKLVFAGRNGEYLSNVQVAIRDPQGDPVLEETANGPWFLADLAPGTYTVTASGFGKRFERTIHVPARGQERELFSWS